MKILFLILFIFVSFNINAFPVPKDKKATFDIIRKNKIIGSVETNFSEQDNDLIIDTTINIKVKVLFFPAYKFFQQYKEIWRNGEFIEFEGYTDFEDEREYFIEGKDSDDKFIATGMDGEIIVDKNIIPLNYWNKEILVQDKIFDTQKGIIRQIDIKKLGKEKIKINNTKLLTDKYLLNASKNPKDIGPFPEYTIWYAENGELIKFQFKNWKDKKIIITQRSDWGE
jgi:hypothetical protein